MTHHSSELDHTKHRERGEAVGDLHASLHATPSGRSQGPSPASTFDKRVDALAKLGRSRVQTEFLVIVALHGGCFLRRHYEAFTGRGRGQVVADLLKWLTVRGMVTPHLLSPSAGVVYHLHSKGVYRAIGQTDNRNRREISIAMMARRIMMLDYLLGADPRGWYATESDKLQLFTTTFGVDERYLPRRTYRPHAPHPRVRTPSVPVPSSGRDGSSARSTGIAGLAVLSNPVLRTSVGATTAAATSDVGETTRYFIHKQPISVVSETGEVQFAHLVTDESGDGTRSFLDDHAPLFERLARWSIIAVCPRHIDGLPPARRVFADFMARFEAPMAAPPLPADVEDLRWFFSVRPSVDRGDLKHLSVPDLNRFRNLRRQLAGPVVDRLFARWQLEGDIVLNQESRDAVMNRPASAGRFIAHQLPWNYRAFGTLAGIV